MYIVLIQLYAVHAPSRYLLHMDLIYAQLLQVSTLGGERTYQCGEDSVVAGKAERMGG